MMKNETTHRFSKIYIYLFIAVFLPISLFAEINTSDSSYYFDSNTWLTGSRQTLPNWIFENNRAKETNESTGASEMNGATEMNKTTEIVAFSDPGLTPNAGHQQALCRAAMLYQLSKGIKIDFLFSTYKGLKKQHWYSLQEQLRMMVRASSVESVYHYAVIEEFRSQFNETYLKIRFDEKEELSFKYQFNLEAFMRYRRSTHNTKKIIYELKSKSSLPLMLTHYMKAEGKSKLSLSIAQFNETQSTNQLKQCWYNNVTTIAIDSVSHYKTSMNSSVWCALMEGVSRSLLVHPYSSFRTKNTSETFNPTQLNDLVRIIGHQSIKLKVTISGVQENHLIMHTQLVEIK